MASSAISSRAGRWSGRSALFIPSPARVELATRLALICALTTLVTEIYQTPDAALTAYVAFFMNRRGRTVSLITSAAMTVVASIVIVLLFLVARMVVDDPMWRVVSIAVISFGLLFLASASKLRPIAGIVAIIVGYALDLLGTVQMGEEATRALLYAWLFVAIPAAASIIVNLLFVPAPRRVAERAIAGHLRACVEFLQRPEDIEASQMICKRAHEGVADILEELKLAGVERSARSADLAALSHAALSTGALLNALEVLTSDPDAHLPSDAGKEIASTLDTMARILERGGYPVDVDLDLVSDPSESLSGSTLREICVIVRHFAVPAQTNINTSEEKRRSFFVEDAFSNPEHVHYALKTTAAALICYGLYSLLDWPGIHTCFITCYIVAQMTAAESIEKLMLRIGGCLIGAGAGIAAIVYLVPSLTSIGGLMTVVFAGTWIAGYLAAGSPRISYAGFQIAFAFFLCVIQGSAPGTDLVVARDRIIGILLGNLVAYLVFVYVWPATISRRVTPALVAGLRGLKRLALAEDGEQRLRAAQAVNSTWAAVETAVDLSRYEPALIRASDAWLATQSAAAEAGRSLGGLLLLASGQTEIPRAAVATRLERVIARFRGEAPGDIGSAGGRVAGPGVSGISSLVEKSLGELEVLSNHASQSREVSPNARS